MLSWGMCLFIRIGSMNQDVGSNWRRGSEGIPAWDLDCTNTGCRMLSEGGLQYREWRGGKRGERAVSFK